MKKSTYHLWKLPLGKLRVLSGEEVCCILRENGFFEVRQRGSHVVMQKTLPGTTITVPVPLHSEIRIGTLQSIIRQSRLNRDSFETGHYLHRHQ